MNIRNIMNIKHIRNNPPKFPRETGGLFARMEHSLKSAQVDIEKSIRLAKTLAPILSDKSSNDRHLKVIGSDAPVHEKVIAILMVGFPDNRPLLPVLREQLNVNSEAIRMAAVIAITQMHDGNNNQLLAEILLSALHKERCSDVKKTIRKALITLLNNQSKEMPKNVVEF